MNAGLRRCWGLVVPPINRPRLPTPLLLQRPDWIHDLHQGLARRGPPGRAAAAAAGACHPRGPELPPHAVSPPLCAARCCVCSCAPCGQTLAAVLAPQNTAPPLWQCTAWLGSARLGCKPGHAPHFALTSPLPAHHPLFGCSYYNHAVHAAAFVLPTFAQEALESSLTKF